MVDDSPLCLLWGVCERVTASSPPSSPPSSSPSPATTSTTPTTSRLVTTMHMCSNQSGKADPLSDLSDFPLWGYGAAVVGAIFLCVVVALVAVRRRRAGAVSDIEMQAMAPVKVE